MAKETKIVLILVCLCLTLCLTLTLTLTAISAQAQEQEQKGKQHTFDEYMDWLDQNDVSEHKSIIGKYQCLQFADDLVKDGEEDGFAFYLTIIITPFGRHAIVAFPSEDTWVFIEPERDEILNGDYKVRIPFKILRHYKIIGIFNIGHEPSDVILRGDLNGFGETEVNSLSCSRNGIGSV